MTISVAPVAIGVVVLAWLGGHYALAIELALLGLAAYIIECAFFGMTSCWCDRGRIRSPFGGGFRWHGRCERTGVRKRWGRRFWDSHH